MKKDKINIYDIVERYCETRYDYAEIPYVYDIIVNFLSALSEGELDEIMRELENEKK